MQFFKALLFLCLLALQLNASCPFIDGIHVDEKIGTLKKVNNDLIAVIDGHSYMIHIKSKYISQGTIDAALERTDVLFYGKFETNSFDAIAIQVTPLVKGFLAPKSCIENREFNDCNLEKYALGEELMIFAEGKNYIVDLSRIKKSELDQAVLKNLYIYGYINEGKIVVEHIAVLEYQVLYISDCNF